MKISDCNNCTSTICTDHRTQLHKALGTGPDSIPAHYVELNLHLTPGRAGNDDTPVTTTKTRRLPIASNIRAAQEHLLTTVTTTEAWVREQLRFAPAPRRGREGPTLQAACQLLRDYLDTWTSDPDATSHAARLLTLTGHARNALGVAGPRHNRIDLPCPQCHTRNLRRANGRDDIGCMYCAAVVPLEWLEAKLELNPDRKAA